MGIISLRNLIIPLCIGLLGFQPFAQKFELLTSYGNFNPIRGTTYARLSQLIWLYHEGPMHYPFPCTSAYPQAS